MLIMGVTLLMPHEQLTIFCNLPGRSCKDKACFKEILAGFSKSHGAVFVMNPHLLASESTVTKDPD